MNEIPMIAGVGINHSTVSEGDVEGLGRRLAELKTLGCDFAEISARMLDIVVGGRLNAPRARDILAVCADQGLRYTLHAPHVINFMDEPLAERHRDTCRASLEFAEQLGATVMVIHAGIAPRAAWSAGPERLLAVERAALAEMGDVAAAHGVTLCVENLNAGKSVLTGESIRYSNDPRRLADQIARIDHPHVAATLDFQHAYMGSGHAEVNFTEGCLAMAPVSQHLHVHDGFGLPLTALDTKPGDQVALGQGDLHMPMGWGDIDWEGLLPQLRVRPGTVFMMEIKARYAREIPACITEAKRLAQLVGTAAA